MIRGEPAVEEERRKKRLSREDWIEGAIDGLLSEGPSAVRVTRLASRLGVTPGSFYWHFRDRDDLRDRVLQHWRDRMLRQAAAAGQLAGTGAEQIRALIDILVKRRLPDLDGAMRDWAREDAVGARGVARADELRLGVLTAMFREAGLDNERAQQRARIVWWFFRGSRGVEEAERLRTWHELVEALLRDAPRGRRSP